MRSRMFTSAALVLITVVGATAQPQVTMEPRSTTPFNASQEVYPTTPFLPDLTPGYVVVEGCIQIRLDQYLSLMAGTEGTFATNRWTGQIPFDFVTSGTGAVSAQNQQRAINAMVEIQNRTGVEFVQAIPSDPDRIRFQNSGFNNSPVGRQGGTQIINIVNWEVEIIIIHELYHSLGFWHEHSRSDRGTFVTINGANICGGGTGGCAAASCCLCQNATSACISCAFNFNLQSGAGTLGPYDFDSLMHYGRTAFSCNTLDTITVNAPWNAQWQSQIGQRDHFSWLDTMSCRGLYPRAGDVWLDNTFGGPVFQGTMQNPFNASFAVAYNIPPINGAILIRNSGHYSALGTFSRPMTIYAATGPVTLGN